MSCSVAPDADHEMEPAACSACLALQQPRSAGLALVLFLSTSPFSRALHQGPVGLFPVLGDVFCAAGLGPLSA